MTERTQAAAPGPGSPLAAYRAALAKIEPGEAFLARTRQALADAAGGREGFLSSDLQGAEAVRDAARAPNGPAGAPSEGARPPEQRRAGRPWAALRPAAGSVWEALRSAGGRLSAKPFRRVALPAACLSLALLALPAARLAGTFSLASGGAAQEQYSTSMAAAQEQVSCDTAAPAGDTAGGGAVNGAPAEEYGEGLDDSARTPAAGDARDSDDLTGDGMADTSQAALPSLGAEAGEDSSGDGDRIAGRFEGEAENSAPPAAGEPAEAAPEEAARRSENSLTKENRAHKASSAFVPGIGAPPAAALTALAAGEGWRGGVPGGYDPAGLRVLRWETGAAALGDSAPRPVIRLWVRDPQGERFAVDLPAE